VMLGVGNVSPVEGIAKIGKYEARGQKYG